MHRTFIYASSFLRVWTKAGLDDDDLTKLEEAIMDDPTIGAVIEGCAGVRKVRWARPGTGKSGGVRVFYLDLDVWGRTYILAVILKNEEANMSKAERNELAAIVQKIKDVLEKSSKKH